MNAFNIIYAVPFDNRPMMMMTMMMILLLMVTTENISISDIMYIHLDSGSEAPDNDRSEDINTPLQAAYKVVIIEVESNSYSGIHELAGTDQTNPTTDYWAQQSQLVGTQSHQSTKSEAHEIKHHILITNRSSISMTTEEVYTTNLVRVVSNKKYVMIFTAVHCRLSITLFKICLYQCHKNNQVIVTHYMMRMA